MARSVTLGGERAGLAQQQSWITYALATSLALNLALAAFIIVRLVSSSSANDTATSVAIDHRAWYAVFTGKDNFVGHISNLKSDEMDMQDIYFLTFSATDANGSAITNPKPEDYRPVVCKLGSPQCDRFFGPRDFIRINRSDVQYYVELRNDSPIVKAISAFEGASPAPSQPRPQPKPSL
jgi:hypothetical protein